MVLMPPKIKTQDYLMKVCVYRAEGLKVSDITSKSSDPFVKLNFGSLKEPLETKVVKKSLNPEWNQGEQ